MIAVSHEQFRRAAIDWLAPVVILGIGIVNVARRPHSVDYPGDPLEHIAFLALALAGLGLRRREPLLAPMLAIITVTVWSEWLWPAGAQGPFEGFLVLVGAAYAIGALNQGRRLAAGAVLLIAYFVIGQVVVLASGGRDGDLLPVAVWLAAAWGVGVVIRRRGEQAREAREEAVVLTVDHQRRTAEAVEQERARIARELHDVVAHGLSVIVVQAAAERRSLSHGTCDAATVDGVLGSIERTGREAMVDLRRLLGLLRQIDEPPALAPQPTLAQLDGLVGQVRDADVDVDVRVEGEPFPLPPGLDLTAYRIVQEALTNILKHAHAAHVEIALIYRRNQIELSVVDDGPTRATGDLATVGAGHGLLGMRERVSVFGGTVTAGSRPGGGWTVQARLPVSPVQVER